MLDAVRFAPIWRQFLLFAQNRVDFVAGGQVRRNEAQNIQDLGGGNSTSSMRAISDLSAQNHLSAQNRSSCAKIAQPARK